MVDRKGMVEGYDNQDNTDQESEGVGGQVDNMEGDHNSLKEEGLVISLMGWS